VNSFNTARRDADEIRYIDDCPAYDYGVRTSLRQEASPASNWIARKNRKSMSSVTNGRSKNFGVSVTEQEDSEEDVYHLYFQRLDKEMYYKILERQVFNSILSLLKRKGIDVTEFMQRQNQILNNNTLVNNGILNNNGILSQGNNNTNTQGSSAGS
jgi:hypothetical protein